MQLQYSKELPKGRLPQDAQSQAGSVRAGERQSTQLQLTGAPILDLQVRHLTFGGNEQFIKLKAGVCSNRSIQNLTTQPPFLDTSDGQHCAGFPLMFSIACKYEHSLLKFQSIPFIV